jgi:hypothetical protein
MMEKTAANAVLTNNLPDMWALLSTAEARARTVHEGLFEKKGAKGTAQTLIQIK